MSKLFKFEVVTPVGVFYKDEVEYINFKAINGDMGVMKGHAPMLVANKPCTLVIEKDKEKKYAFISEGFIEITSEKVSAVVDFAGFSNELDEEELIKRQRNAEEELENSKDDLSKKTELKASIERTKAALKTASMRD